MFIASNFEFLTISLLIVFRFPEKRISDNNEIIVTKILHIFSVPNIIAQNKQIIIIIIILIIIIIIIIFCMPK